jgi:phosphoribosylformylglycinamidine (FGAM) synthase-like amidotransferase family enzyme
MTRVRALIVAGNGTNCERETAFACRAAGADQADVVFLWDLIAGETRLRDYNFLCLPGGFLDGDDLGAGRAAANRYRHARIGGDGPRLGDELRAFVDAGNLVLGICNGFQLMVKLGLLPDPKSGEQVVTLAPNDSGRFEDRWVELAVDPESPCVFTKGLRRLPVPVRHGEGKLLAGSAALLQDLDRRRLVPVRYLDPGTGVATETYPHNPNGSPGGAAGLCDETGRLFGLMPHPECFIHRTHHPRWARLPDMPEEGRGLMVFRNAVEFLRDS